MARHLSTQQDLFSHLVDGHKIHARQGEAEEKIVIERLELRLGQPTGVRLQPSRVHALSTVRRRQPIYLLPPRPPMIVNRSTELETLRQSVVPRHVVDLHGLDGAGKSTLVAAFAHELDFNHFPDGAVYATGHLRHQDLLQALFDFFYESDSPVKIAVAQSHTYLANLRALVILDEAGLGPKQVDPILDALNEAAVLVVGPDRVALGRGRAVRLKGLPRQDAVALFKKASAPKPSAEESPMIDQICILLNDMPLPITGVASQTAHSKNTLTQLLTDLQGRRPWAGPGGDLSVGPSLEEIVLVLDAADRQIMTLVAAFARPGASSEALRRMLNLSTAEFQQRVERLQELGLLTAVGPTQWVFTPRTREFIPPRLRLVSAYYQTARSWLVDDGALRQVVSYYSTRLSRGDQLSGDELPGLLGAIEDCARNGWLDYLKPMVFAADRSLARLGWWSEWQHHLDLARRCAQAGGDRTLEAWAVHQLGSVLGALGEFDRAFHLLRTAVNIRQALGDETGAAQSAHNLEFLQQMAPAPVEEKILPSPDPTESHEDPDEPTPKGQGISEPAPTSTKRKSRVKIRIALLTALVLAVIGTFALRYATGIGPSENPAPDFTVSWEFGDAWNALNEETWTQQVRIVVEGGDGDYDYFVNGEPTADTFEVVLPLCEGSQGNVRVESGDGQSAEFKFEFDSPYCR
jgi:hypothetical protein